MRVNKLLYAVSPWFRPRSSDRKLLSEVIEVTGAPCCGKTTWIKFHFSGPGQCILLGSMPLSYGKIKRALYSIVLSFYAVASRSISFKQIWWLVKKAAIYDETLFSRVNALRNSMTKFGYPYFRQKYNVTLIDEGISQIPFLLGLEREHVDSFIMLFRNLLEKNRIIFIEAPPKKILKARIITRGHKRVRTVKDAEGFVDRNVRIAEYYKKAITNAGFDVSII